MKGANSFTVPFAIVLILYGIIKIVIGSIALFSKGKHRENVRNANKVLEHAISDDETFAGKAFDIALMLFGIYTILHGLHLLEIIPPYIGEYILSRTFVLSLHMIIGLALIIFYVLVIYTDVKIDKQQSHMNRYKIEGIVSGLLFLVMVPMLLAYYSVKDHGFVGAWQKSPLLMSLYIIVALCMVFLVVNIFFTATKNDNDKNTKNKSKH